MPTTVGNWWEYQVTEERSFTPPRTYKVRLEIYDEETNYQNKGRLAYLIDVQKDGVPQPDLTASPVAGNTSEEDRCDLERNGLFVYLMQNNIAKGTWTQTGLVVDFPLQYRGDQIRTTPAGRFDCREMFYDNGNEYRPETWNEYYAENKGLVGFYYTYKEYDTSVPPRLIDWRTVTYELLDFNIEPPTGS
ncbi:MAG: hypothetical protein JSU81_04210 [Candidatus Coatesbacteria bacterium]|nr:MAG: hypothetical protein JSU81_04210 [Candidatus Coatesbacteria bacterium]